MENETVKRKRISTRDRKKLFLMFDGRCAYCGKEIKFREMQADHKIPIHLGGEDSLVNMMPACRSCNHYKATFTVEKFREYIAGIPKRLRRDSVAFQVGERFGLVEVHNRPVRFYFEEMICANEECEYNSKEPCAAAVGCDGYMEVEHE